MSSTELRRWRETRNLTRIDLATLLTQISRKLSPADKAIISHRTIEMWEQDRGKIPVFIKLALREVDELLGMRSTSSK